MSGFSDKIRAAMRADCLLSLLTLLQVQGRMPARQLAEELGVSERTTYRAVWQDRRLSLCYHPLPGIEIDQTVDPYGLVAKSGVWYLVCAHKGQLRAHRVSNLIASSSQTETFERPSNAWRAKLVLRHI